MSINAIIILIEIMSMWLYNQVKAMPLSAKELEKILLDDGWIPIGQKGSHRHYVHPVKKGKITIPFHGGTIKRGTEKEILKQAGLRR